MSLFWTIHPITAHPFFIVWRVWGCLWNCSNSRNNEDGSWWLDTRKERRHIKRVQDFRFNKFTTQDGHLRFKQAHSKSLAGWTPIKKMALQSWKPTFLFSETRFQGFFLSQTLNCHIITKSSELFDLIPRLRARLSSATNGRL